MRKNPESRVDRMNCLIDSELHRLYGVPIPDLDFPERARSHRYLDNYVVGERKITQLGDELALTEQTVFLDDEGNFTNVTDICIGSSYIFEVVTNEKPMSLRNIMRRKKKKEEKPIVCIDAGFFFLADGKDDVSPRNTNYNLNISDGQIKCLSVADRPVAMVANGKLEARELLSTGNMIIGNQQISWIGSKSSLKRTFKEGIIYNSTNCIIKHIHHPDTGTKREVAKDLNQTPYSEKKIDIVIDYDDEGNLFVSNIRPNGGSDFFEGSFIVQLPKSYMSRLKIGDVVRITEIDDIDLNKTHIQSAITIGPNIFDDTDSPVFRSMGGDKSHCGDNPVFVAGGKRAARSILWKDRVGNLHFTILDGAPKSDLYKGVTLEEVPEIITKEKAKWAFYLDGGQSARSNLRDPRTGELYFYGNYHYARWPSDGSGQQFLNTAPVGRRVPSAIVVYKK